MSIGVSIRIGGTSDRNTTTLAWLRGVHLKATELFGDRPSDISLLLVFDVPGPILQPPYSGMRTGRYSPEKKTLQVQIATPEGFDSSEQFADFLGRSLHEAIEVAEKYFHKRKIPFDRAELEAAASALASTQPAGN